MKKIMYGVTDFERMRAENAYFVDRTGMIRELEKTSYAMFLRLRRFGKSLWRSVLQCYYDVDYAARFEEFFGGLDIGLSPTPEHGKYLFIDFNFTGVEKQFDRVQESFNSYCSLREQGGTVTLHRIVVVFHGGDVVMCEEIKDCEGGET